jgi:uncharacterized protein YxjI
MSTDFFTPNNYFIDEKVNFLKFENEYKIFDENGNHIGFVKQKLSGGQKALRLFLNKAMLPFRLDIEDMNGNIQASLTRGWTFWMSKVTILDGNGTTIALVRRKFKLLKPRFVLTNAEARPIGEIKGDWKAWNFSITDNEGREIGKVTKKWAGAMKEIFTTADKYVVSIDPGFSHPTSKKALLACAITIDMVLKENK